MEARNKTPCRFFLSGSCLKGENCRFEHYASEQLSVLSSFKSSGTSETTIETKYPCRFFMRSGCRFGDACKYSHDASLKNVSKDEHHEEGDLCTICLEKPLMYGLLLNCNHSFCLQCVRKWRRTKKTVDPLDPAMKTSLLCPICRSFSLYVVPSFVGFPKGGEGKSKTIELYHEKLATIDCRYFMNSSPNRRFCPFGDECFYKHPGNTANERYSFGPSFHNRLLRRRENRRFLGSFVGGEELLFSEVSAMLADQNEWISYEFDDYSDNELTVGFSELDLESNSGEIHAFETMFSNLASSDWLEHQNNLYLNGYSRESSVSDDLYTDEFLDYEYA